MFEYCSLSLIFCTCRRSIEKYCNPILLKHYCNYDYTLKNVLNHRGGVMLRECFMKHPVFTFK